MNWLIVAYIGIKIISIKSYMFADTSTFALISTMIRRCKLCAIVLTIKIVACNRGYYVLTFEKCVLSFFFYTVIQFTKSKYRTDVITMVIMIVYNLWKTCWNVVEHSRSPLKIPNNILVIACILLVSGFII